MPPALPRAILLDLDDTILVFDSASPASWSAACRRLSHRLDGIAPETLSGAFEQEGLWYWGDPARQTPGSAGNPRRQYTVSGNRIVASRECGIFVTDDHDAAMSENTYELNARDYQRQPLQ